MVAISNYFNKLIEEIAYDDEDNFTAVLLKAFG